MDKKSGGTPNPLNPTPLEPMELETAETPEMMAGPWNAEEKKGSAAEKISVTEEVDETKELVAPGAVTTVKVQMKSSVAPGKESRTEAVRVSRTPRPAKHVRPHGVTRPAAKPTNTAPEADSAMAGLDGLVATSVARPAMVSQPVQSKSEVAPKPAAATSKQIVTQSKPAATPSKSTAEPRPKQKKRHGWLIALIILLLIAIAGSATAVAILRPWEEPDQRVATAIMRLLSSNRPQKLSLTGSIIRSSSNPDDPIETATISFDSGVNLKRKENFANTSFKLLLRDGRGVEFDMEEVSTSDGDLYLRPSNLTGSVGAFEVLENEWVRISAGSGDELADLTELDSSALCLTSALGALDDDLSATYEANPFFTYSTEGLTKPGEQYQLKFDNEKLANFINAAPSGNAISSLMGCLGQTSTRQVTTSTVAAITSKIEDLYVEIDENDNLVWLGLDWREGEVLTALEVKIGYPATVTVVEPNYYTDLEQILQELALEVWNEYLEGDYLEGEETETDEIEPAPEEIEAIFDEVRTE